MSDNELTNVERVTAEIAEEHKSLPKNESKKKREAREAKEATRLEEAAAADLKAAEEAAAGGTEEKKDDDASSSDKPEENDGVDTEAAAAQPSEEDAVEDEPAEEPEVNIEIPNDEKLTGRVNACLNTLALPGSGINQSQATIDAQAELYRTFVTILMRKDEDIVKNYLDTLLALANKHSKGSFSSKNAFRGLMQLSSQEGGLSAAQTSELQMIIRIIVDCADTDTRHDVASGFNWDVVQSAFSPRNGEKLVGVLKQYFNV